MRVLWVKANKLLPVSSGGDIRSYQIARRIAGRHELCFLSYYDGAHDPAYEVELKRHFPNAVAICTGKRSGGMLTRGADYLRHVGSRVPYAVSRFQCDAVRGFIGDCFDAGRADVAVCDFLDAAINFPEALSLPSVLFQHNVESEIWRRHALTETNPLKRAAFQVEYNKMLGYEKNAVARFHHVIAVSAHDSELMGAWTKSSRLSVVPTGVDLERYQPDPKAGATAPLVMFVGAMDWEPNIDGAEFFCSQVWPKIQRSHSQARLRLVGRNPDKRVQRLVSDSVEITGFVSSVVDHLREAAVVVVPLRVGGGTRLKIYEAMAMGKAVVSTTVGAEGLDVHPGQDIVFADDPEAFANAVVQLLNDWQMRRRYELAAAETAAQHGWPAVAEGFAEVLERVRTRVLAETGLCEAVGR